jgi:hypothetical protein
MAILNLGITLPNLNSLIQVPRFITGEPGREWSFLFRLIPPVFEPAPAPEWTLKLFSTLPMLYISGLAERVNLPSEKFTLAQAQFSTLQVSFPKGYEIPTFSVQYLEDELGLVSYYHTVWMSNCRGYLGNEEEGGGVVFEELGKVCASALYAHSKKLPLVGEIPLMGDLWPAILPVDITRDPANRGGSNITKVTVTYARIPVWSMPGAIYMWTPPDGMDERWVPGSWEAMAKKASS